MAGVGQEQIKGVAQAGSQVAASAPLDPSLRGYFTHTVDEKGRVSLPAEFRRALEAADQKSVVLTNYVSDGSRCVEGFTPGGWESLLHKLRQQSRFNSKVQKLENFFVSRASECPIDSSGRILIPPYLRTYATLEREVTFAASVHGFRLWDRRVWELIFAQTESELLADPDLFDGVDQLK